MALVEDTFSKDQTTEQRTRCVYSKRGNFLCVLLSSDIYSTEVVDDLLTIHRALESGEICGFTLSKFSEIAQSVCTKLHIEDESVQLRWILENAIGTKEAQTYYYDLTELAGSVMVPAECFLAAA